jgi:hypothetical protein
MPLMQTDQVPQQAPAQGLTNAVWVAAQQAACCASKRVHIFVSKQRASQHSPQNSPWPEGLGSVKPKSVLAHFVSHTRRGPGSCTSYRSFSPKPITGTSLAPVCRAMRTKPLRLASTYHVSRQHGSRVK